MKTDTMTLKEGTIIHYNGMPFFLKNETVVLGRKQNMNIANDFERNRSTDRKLTTNHN